MDAEYEFSYGLCEGIKIEDFGWCCCCVVWWTGNNVLDVVGEGSLETFGICYTIQSHISEVCNLGTSLRTSYLTYI